MVPWVALRVRVYVLGGAAGKRYVGITRDLSRRLREHQCGATKQVRTAPALGDIHNSAIEHGGE